MVSICWSSSLRRARTSSSKLARVGTVGPEALNPRVRRASGNMISFEQLKPPLLTFSCSVGDLGFFFFLPRPAFPFLEPELALMVEGIDFGGGCATPPILAIGG